jgi:hypothetical protein
MRSRNAESINAIFASSRNHVRYLGEHHLMPFLFFKSMSMNLKVRWRQSSGKSDAEDADLAATFYEQYQCRCARCDQVPGSRSRFEETVVQMSGLNRIDSGQSLGYTLRRGPRIRPDYALGRYPWRLLIELYPTLIDANQRQNYCYLIGCRLSTTPRRQRT